MKVEISPVGKINSVIDCPKSKGMTNRALLISALAKGESEISNWLDCDDTRYMMSGLKQFGAQIIEGKALKIKGFNGQPSSPSKEIFTGNSGTTARFLCAVAALDTNSTITGDKRMSERPIKDLTDALKQLGAIVETTNGFPPIKISGTALKGGKISIKGGTSSQFVSAILMILPYAQKETALEIKSVTSRPYIELTLSVMKEFGAEFAVKGNKITVYPKPYQSRKYIVPGDSPNASYFFAAAAVTKGSVKVTGIDANSGQGELKFLDALELMGCKIERGSGWIKVNGSELNGISIDMNEMPDVVQTLAVVAAFAKGKTEIKNVANLRIKETDRLKAMVAELRKIGCEAKETKKGIIINPGKLKGAVIETYDDHRMAMAFSIAGLAVPGIIINEAECVSKTFPNFFLELKRLK